MSEPSGVERLAATVLLAAQRALDRGQWDDASDLARHVLDVVPDHRAALAMLAAIESRGRGALDQGRRYLTVLFADVVGSTPLSERLDAEDYFDVVGAYREAVREVVGRHDGYVDQFQGDGVVAYFGFPVAAEDDQVRAVEAGLDIVLAVREAGRRIGMDLAARVGVHVGRTVMTNSELGAHDRSTAIGFATNVAARIQAVAEPGTVVVSEAAAEAISPFFDLEPVGARHLKGVSEDVEVFRVYEPRARSTMRDDRLGVSLVGREEERRRIDQAWSEAVNGPYGRMLLLTGEPGIGKSRLARYAIDRARDDGAGVIEINCGRDFRHVGLGAVRRGIEKALELGSAPQPGEARAALEARARITGLPASSVQALAALMGDSVDRAPTAELAPDRLREAIIGALQEWVAAEALVTPVVMVVEDLHWADDTAVEALRRLTSAPLPPGVLVLMTARSGEAPAPLAHLLEDAIELGPLTGSDAVDLVRSFASGVDALEEGAVEALARRGEGVPLFTEHLVMAAAAHRPTSGSTDEALPATLEGLLQVRLATSGPGRNLAELAAVVGREFSLALLERVLVELGEAAPLPPTGLTAGLRALQRAGLVEPSGEDMVRFRHSLVRDAAYELQLRAERPRRHRAVARAIVSLHGPDASPEGLAWHFEQAGDVEPAASAYLRAAEAAAGLAEFDISLGHLRSAAALIERIDGPAALRLELAHCMQSGSVLTASFSYTREEAERAYLRAMELCDLIAAEEGPDVGLDVQLVAALGGLWSKEVVAGDLRKAGAVTDRLERLLPGAPADLTPEIRRFVLACRGFEHLFAGATGTAVVTLGEASAMRTGPATVPLGAPHDYVAAVDALLAVARALAGDDRGADEALSRALQRTAQLPFPVGPFSEAVVQVYVSYVKRLRWDVDGARAAVRRISEIGDRHGFREHAMLGQVLGLAASTIEGDSDACASLENVLGIWRMMGGGLAVPVLLAELADGCLRAGSHDRARNALADATAMMEQTDQRGCESEVLRIGALLDRAAGAPDDTALKGLVAAAEVALAGGSLRLGARAVGDAIAVLGERREEAVAGVARRVWAALPPSAGDRRMLERAFSPG